MKALMHNLRGMSDFFFPPSDSLRLIRETTHLDMVALYHPQYHQTVITLAEYQEPCIKAIITAAKFEHNEGALELLTPLLTRYLTDEPLPLATTVFVPVPLHPKRQRERGYNQIESLLLYLQSSHTAPITIMSALKRTRNTEAQSHLGKHERKENVKDAFAMNPLIRPREGITDIVLLDDVVTTGNTLKSAAAVLRKQTASHINIHQVAVARAY